MTRLSDITAEMAGKLVNEVQYGNHIIGTRYHSMAGSIPVLMTYLHEVKTFLHIGSPGSLKTLGGSGAVNYVDLDKLTKWIRDVFDDQELANAIDEEIEKGNSYAERIWPIKLLIEERLSQCYAVLEMKETSVVY